MCNSYPHVQNNFEYRSTCGGGVFQKMSKMVFVVRSLYPTTFYSHDVDEVIRMPTKIELTLKQSQQGVSNDVLVSIEGVEELKRNKNLEEMQIEEEQGAKAQSWKFPVCYDDDDDEEGYNSLNDNIISELPSYSAVTPTEPIDSLSMGDEHLNTIPATESNEFIKSCAENLVPNPKIRFAKRLLYDNSSPRPSKKIVSDNSNADIESFSPSPIPNSDSDPLYAFWAMKIAVGETIPRSVKQIEPILKKIAVSQALGRYILKPDVELESFKKALLENGSFPENNNHRRESTATVSTFPSKSDDLKQFEEPTDLNFEPYEELNTSENIDIEHHTPYISSEKRVPDNSQVANVSFESRSSDSESDSGSDSGSDSESDSGRDNKQGSDEEVDISKVLIPETTFVGVESRVLIPEMNFVDVESRVLIPETTVVSVKSRKSLHVDAEVGFAHNMVDEKDGSGYLELEKELFEDNQEDEMPSFPDKDGDDYADKSPNWAGEGLHKGTTNQMIGRPGGDVSNYYYGKADNTEFSGNHTFDSPRSVPRSIDLNAHAKAPADMENTFRLGDDGSMRSGSHQEKHGSSIRKSTDTSIDNYKKSLVINRRGPTLRRELSDLEMGEFRESAHEEASGTKKRFEKNNSFKQSENMSSSEY
nr:hypothetical protein [Tanacetum cinerariifolium]